MSNTETTHQSLAPWVSHVVVIAVVVATVAVIWTLIEQNRLLKDQLRSSVTASASLDSFSPGDSIPDLAIENTAGSSSSLLRELSGGGIVVFLTTTCPYCEESLPEWNQIHQTTAELGQSFIALSFDSFALTRDYSKTRRLNIPLWTLTTPSKRTDLKVSAVPLTLAVMPNGKIDRVWQGRLSPRMTSDIIASVRQGVENQAATK